MLFRQTEDHWQGAEESLDHAFWGYLSLFGGDRATKRHARELVHATSTTGKDPPTSHSVGPCNRGLITKFVPHRLVPRRVPPALSSHLDYQLLGDFSIYRHSIIKLTSIYIIRGSNKS